MNEKRLVREFQLEHSRCQSYFDLMYKTLQFTFAAVIAIIGIGFGAFNDNVLFSMVFSYVLPVCLYVFGVLYAYNAYALAISGRRAELLHAEIYSDMDMTIEFSEVIKKYVIADRSITMISYGVPLGFYLVAPATSIIFSMVLCTLEELSFLFHILPLTFLVIYFVIMSIVIIKIVKPHFEINKIQKTSE